MLESLNIMDLTLQWKCTFYIVEMYISYTLHWVEVRMECMHSD
jgi:hypothetical protein